MTTTKLRTEPSLDASLGTEMIAYYRDQGFLLIPDFLNAAELQELSDLYDEIVRDVTDYLAQRVGKSERGLSELRTSGYMIPVNRPERLRPELLETVAYQKARHFIAKAHEVDPDRLSVHGRIWHKPPQVGAPTPWHQDEPNYDDDDILTSATVSVALDEATIQGGCLHYIPLSFNRHENLPHISRAQDAPPGFTGTGTFSWVAPEALDESLATPGTVPAGGATMHHMRTLHYAGWNRSSVPRRSIAIRYSLHGSR